MKKLKELKKNNELLKTMLLIRKNSHSLKEKRIEFMLDLVRNLLFGPKLLIKRVHMFISKYLSFILLSGIIFHYSKKSFISSYKNSCVYNSSFSCLYDPFLFKPLPTLSKNVYNIDLYFSPNNSTNSFISKLKNEKFEIVIQASNHPSRSTFLHQNYHDEIFASQAIIFKGILDAVYKEFNIINHKCNKSVKNLTGFLNSTLMLKMFDLTDLVQFYNASINYVWLKKAEKKSYITTSELPEINANFTLNRSNFNFEQGKTIKKVNYKYWNLWNSDKMSMLNISNKEFGEDGSRIELGNF